jgi:hypothetical protein
MSLVLETPRGVALVSPIYAGLCKSVSQKTSSRDCLINSRKGLPDPGFGGTRDALIGFLASTSHL